MFKKSQVTLMSTILPVAILLAPIVWQVTPEQEPEAATSPAIVEEIVSTEAAFYISPEAQAPVYETPLTEDEINLIALVTMAEAEGESELGKRLVIDTILNRTSHPSYWGSTVYETVYQKGAFSSMWNGRVNRCYVRDDIVQLVKEEMVQRTNYDVVYFRTGRYSSYGTPLFKEGHHYFSSI